jgi:hypothetical protein
MEAGLLNSMVAVIYNIDMGDDMHWKKIVAGEWMSPCGEFKAVKMEEGHPHSIHDWWRLLDCRGKRDKMICDEKTLKECKEAWQHEQTKDFEGRMKSCCPTCGAPFRAG